MTRVAYLRTFAPGGSSAVNLVDDAALPPDAVATSLKLPDGTPIYAPPDVVNAVHAEFLRISAHPIWRSDPSYGWARNRRKR